MRDKNVMAVDWINLVLAIILAISPWVFGYATGNVMLNAVIAGVIIGVVAILALVSYAQWEEWVNLVLGAWVVISPFVLGFADITAAVWTHVVIGLAVAILAAAELYLVNRNPPPQIASR